MCLRGVSCLLDKVLLGNGNWKSWLVVTGRGIFIDMLKGHVEMLVKQKCCISYLGVVLLFLCWRCRRTVLLKLMSPLVPTMQSKSFFGDTKLNIATLVVKERRGFRSCGALTVQRFSGVVVVRIIRIKNNLERCFGWYRVHRR